MHDADASVDCLLITPPDDFSRYPYLGVCALAGVLEQQGIRARILDCAALGLSTEDDILAHITALRPAIIGISVMSMMLRQCYNLVQAIQRRYPHATLVIGGAHINADPEMLVAMGVRYGFYGECEYSFAEFCARTLRGDAPGDLPGLLINVDGHLTKNPPAIVEDLDALPMPAYHLLPIGRYYSPSTSLRVMSVITSRGCPFNCVFCSKLQKVKHRRLSVERVIAQLRLLIEEHGIGWIEFVDEIFTLNREWILALCRAIAEAELTFKWGMGTRADCLDEEMVRAMKAAGCEKIGFGVETGSESLRFSGHKKITNAQYLEAVALCNRYGIQTLGSYIFGHPGETEADMRQTIRFARQLPTHYAYFHKMIPIPNSELFDTAVKSGAIPADIWTTFMRGETPHPLYYPDTTPRATLDRIYRRAWLSWYLTPTNLRRVLSKHFTPAHLWKSGKAFIALALKDRYRK